MSSRLGVIALAFAAFGCSEDAALLVNAGGRALTEVELVPPNDTTSEIRDTGSYRWFTTESPIGSDVQDPRGDATATFLPDVRGAYLIERWFVSGVGEDLTHRFVVQVSGLAPTALLGAHPSPYTVGTSVLLDGSASSSAEGRSLTYHWRLVLRPLGSQSTVEQGTALSHLVPDVAGDYVVELAVFDGELWNEGTTTASVTVQ
jgi:hypothetical protein